TGAVGVTSPSFLLRAAHPLLFVGCSQQFGQLRYVARYPARFILGKHLSDVGSVFCLTRIDIRKRLSVGVKDFEAAWNLLHGPWRREIILFGVLLIVIFGISYLRIVSVACLWPAPYSFHQEPQGPTQNPRQPYRDKSQQTPTAPVGNGKSLPQFFIAVLHTPLPRPILVNAKPVSVPGYTPIVIFPAKMKLSRPTNDQTHGGNDPESLPTKKAH